MIYDILLHDEQLLRLSASAAINSFPPVAVAVARQDLTAASGLSVSEAESTVSICTLHVQQPTVRTDYLVWRPNISVIVTLTAATKLIMIIYLRCCQRGTDDARIHPVHLMNADSVPDDWRPGPRTWQSVSATVTEFLSSD